MLSRHWPELDRVTKLNSSGVLHLIAKYGSPQSVCDDRIQAEAFLHQVRRGVANPGLVGAILDSAEASLGVPCTAGERHLLQVLAEDLLRTHKALRALERRIAERVNRDPQLQLLGKSFGKTTALVLETALGSPLDYPDPRAYIKAMGLNLKERSSGQHKGRLKITKRGPGRARHYLLPVPERDALRAKGPCDPCLVPQEGRTRWPSTALQRLGSRYAQARHGDLARRPRKPLRQP